MPVVVLLSNPAARDAMVGRILAGSRSDGVVALVNDDNLEAGRGSRRGQVKAMVDVVISTTTVLVHDILHGSHSFFA